MLTRVGRIMVGDGANSTALPANLAATAAGDLVVVTTNNTILVAGDTSATSEQHQIIKIAQTIAAGNYRFSLPIIGKGITSAKRTAYVAPVAHRQEITITNVSNSQLYKFVIVFNDENRFLDYRQTRQAVYYNSDASATAAEIATALATKINADRFLSTLVIASNPSAGVIRVEARAIPTNTIDKYGYLTFDSTVSKFDSSVPNIVQGDEVLAGTVSTTQQGTSGAGSAQQIYDLERELAARFKGYSNFVQFPVLAFPRYSVSGSNYDVIAIEHFGKGEGSMNKQSDYPQITYIAVPTGSAQLTYLQGILNPYLAALGFAAV